MASNIHIRMPRGRDVTNRFTPDHILCNNTEYSHLGELPALGAYRRRFVAALICVTGLLPGCAGRKAEVTPGEVLHVHEEFDFFFHKHGDRYAHPPIAEVKKLFVQKSWSVPKRVTMERPEVNVTTAKITWREGRRRSEADGYRVTISCVLTIAEDAQPGDKVLAVSFPALVEATKAWEVTPRTTKGTSLLSPSDVLEVQEITIHQSQAGKYYAIYRPPVLIAGGVLAVVIIVVSARMMLERGPTGRGSIVCQYCGLEAPTKHVAFYQNIGLVVARFTDSVEGFLCKSCIHSYFWRCTATTFFLGWWGIPTVVITPFILMENTLRYILCLGMPALPFGAEEVRLSEEVLKRLGAHADELVKRLSENHPLDQVAEDIAAKAGVTPAQVALYVRAVIAAQESDPN